MTEPAPRARIAVGNPTAPRVTHYRVELPRAGIVSTGHGHFEATEFAEVRRGFKGRYLDARDRLIGKTLANYRLETERLSKVKALAVFSSDAISSVAYAPQEIIFVLVLAGSGALHWSLPLAAAICLLLAIVVASYRQTVRAYPNGGGSYIVAHENLGITAGLVAAASLLTDYVLTVSVSVAAGIDALASLNGDIRAFAVPLAVGIVCLVALVNLRGVRESGTFFAIPTYAFIVLLTLAIAVALTKIVFAGENPLGVGAPREQIEGQQALGLFLLLKAFASGCSAMTGVEAISNGVQAFQRPAAKNASQTLVAMGLILGFLFMGSTLVARHLGIVPHEDDTILAQIGAQAFGDGSVLFSALNIMTAGILILAANTSFADFPRLAAILARDGYMPRIFHARGNRLVFSVGIIALTALAALLLVMFNATTTRLIPLYALGVFLSFTLSQAGMVRHWIKEGGAGASRAMVINGIGALTTALVFVIIVVEKFRDGAWVVCILIPVLAFIAFAIGRFYHNLRRSLNVPSDALLDIRPAGTSAVPVVVPIEEINLAAVMAISAACREAQRVIAVHVEVDPDEPSTVEERWRAQFPHIPLVVIESPYRSVAEPINVYISDLLREAPHEVRVLVPLLEVRGLNRVLVNQGLKRLQSLLAHRRHVVVTPFWFTPTAAARLDAK